MVTGESVEKVDDCDLTLVVLYHIHKNMTIGDWLKWAKTRIDALDAELIALANFAPAGADRSWLVAHSNDEIGGQGGLADTGGDANVVKNTTFLLKKAEKMVMRREQGEPLAYILGEKEFYGRKFVVNPAVLIPRPETESLIELALGALGCRLGGDGRKVRSEQGLNENGTGVVERGLGAKILEVGTGSGCIAVTLALELPGVEVVATDVSLAALEVAKENAERLGAKISFLESDLLENVLKSSDFDLIVANLPYVDPNWEWLERKTLDFEPSLALYAEKRGLALYERLLQQAIEMELADWLILEADPCQYTELTQMAGQQGWKVDKIVGFGLRLARMLSVN